MNSFWKHYRPPPQPVHHGRFEKICRFVMIGMVCCVAVLLKMRARHWLKDLGVGQGVANIIGIDGSSFGTKSEGSSAKGLRVLTREELAKHSSDAVVSGLPVYVAILGEVFDVSTALQHYGPEGHYKGLAGVDATRSFATGDFSANGLLSEVDGLGHDEILAINDWVSQYQKKYPKVGLVEGHYYNKQGEMTAKLETYRGAVAAGKEDKRAEEELRKRFPPCNSRYAQGEGSQVWCTPKSGGIARSWAGLPRQFYSGPKAQKRCACVKEEDLSLAAGRIKEYPNCDPKSVRCQLK
eukprot:gnl/MRDRNA2_/MRDRNA2_27216_c0_seq1.p1 gnl/MRDRNA2_/MRDRNA2_27216_c0~~gnl/MRDRNA2_/MRDRNA2_27216_c0_seq1.p1  ORF type:complete len:295 (-),score=57.98 gnl/MRDRNA2_/MRDRNA2_27216_c0_seq1:16-900(-)